MNRLFALVGSTVVAGLVGWSPDVLAQSGASRPVSDGQGRRVAFALSGSIEGVVVDEHGSPLVGAMVSALGSTSTIAVTDRRGAFVLRALPAGAYMVRAHMSGFAPSRRQLVEVRATSSARFSVTLQHSAATLVPSPQPRIPPPPKVLSAGLLPVGAGFDLLSVDPLGAREESANASEDRTEKAWRIRHLPRSVLKETTERVAKAPENAGAIGKGQPGTAAAIARALGTPARLLGDLPLTGQVDLMTSGSFDGGPSPSSSDTAIRGTAFFNLAGPAWGYGDWSARLVTQGDLGSWFLSGAFRNRSPSSHLYNVGFSYSTQRMAPPPTMTRWSLDRTELAGRAAGSIYGLGRFVLSPRLMIDYGGRYSRYDYLGGAGLFSPNVMVALVPLDRLRIRAGVSRRMLAPGAEEFLEPLTSGLWVPPERTFVGVSPMVPERTSQYDVVLEHDITPNMTLALRSYYQNTTDQQIAFFGGAPNGQEQRHYGIGNAGDVVARGWSAGVTYHLLSRLRGTVAYEITEARWLPTVPGYELLLLGVRPRPAGERLHGVTTSMETDIPVTATHVYLSYRFNTGFERREGDSTGAGLDSRFDVQVSQRLPFLDFTSAQWQVLVAVKNLFRDTTRDSSVYDELLVVKPPTRILGGVVVRF
jgi:hypothetical protein